MVSPDEAFRSAQSRASRLAHQRRQAAQKSRNSPNPAHKKGNISGRNSKSSAAPLPKSAAPSSKAPHRDPKPSSMPSSIPPRQTPKDDISTAQKSTQKDLRAGKNTHKNTSSPSVKKNRENNAHDKKDETLINHATSRGKNIKGKDINPETPHTSSRGKHAKKKDSKGKVSSFFSKKKSPKDSNPPARDKSVKKKPDYTNTQQTSFPAVSQNSYSSPDKKDDKDNNTVHSSFTEKKDDTAPDNNSDLSHKKDTRKKKHSWFSRKSKAQVSTDLEDKDYDTISSSDDLEEVKEKAHLSQRDTDKILDTYDDYKVKQQVRSNGRKVEKIPRIYVVIPRKKKFFKVITSIWAFILTVALAVLCVYGYSVYNEAEMGKEKDAAYAEGVKYSGKDPDISSLMKMNTQQLSNKILAAQGANFPDNATVDTFSLAGWTYPGGTQKESKAEIDFCYAGDGQKRSQGSVFFYTPDAVSTNPEWTVDTISLTQTPCGG